MLAVVVQVVVVAVVLHFRALQSTTSPAASIAGSIIAGESVHKASLLWVAPARTWVHYVHAHARTHTFVIFCLSKVVVVKVGVTAP